MVAKFEQGRSVAIIQYLYRDDTPTGVNGIITGGGKNTRIAECLALVDREIAKAKQAGQVTQFIQFVKSSLDTLGRIEPEVRTEDQQFKCMAGVYALAALGELKEDDHNTFEMTYMK